MSNNSYETLGRTDEETADKYVKEGSALLRDLFSNFKKTPSHDTPGTPLYPGGPLVQTPSQGPLIALIAGGTLLLATLIVVLARRN